MLADDGIKERLSKYFGKNGTYYRITYNLISIVGLAGILYFNTTIPSAYLIKNSLWNRTPGWLLVVAGILVLRTAFRQYSTKSFLGLQSEANEVFKVRGILSYIRHPIYSATILVVAGSWLLFPDLPTLVSVCCILIYLAIGIPLEERKLIKKYGDAYREYKQSVPALIPNSFKKGFS